MTEISKEYAEALFLLACEEKAEREYMMALDEIGALLRDTPELMALLSSPAIPWKERKEAALAVFGGNVPRHVLSFLQLLCEKGRIRSFEDCKAEYRRLLQIKESVISAKVVSTVPLTEDETRALTQNLEKKCGKTVTLVCSVDPSLLGGLVVELDGTVMDGSLRHRLHEVKEVMNR